MRIREADSAAISSSKQITEEIYREVIPGLTV
jgi:hypothetical protein